MSTSEYRSVDAESDLPFGAAELAALASQLYAASIRPGPDSPPQSAPVAPRGSVPDTTAAASAGQTAAGSADLYSAPVPLIGVTDIYVPAPTSPGTRTATAGGAGRSARQRAGYDGGALGRAGGRQRRRSYLPPADLSAFAVPSAGIVPTVPGVLAGARTERSGGTARFGAVLGTGGCPTRRRLATSAGRTRARRAGGAERAVR